MIQRVVIVLTLLMLAGCGGVDPNSPLGKRKAIFQQMMNVSEDMGGMLRGRLKYNEQQFVDYAAELDRLSQQPWQYFADDADADKSSAKDDLWQQKEHFNELAQALEQATAQLVIATQQQPMNQDALAVRVEQVERSCKNCHDAFRIY